MNGFLRRRLLVVVTVASLFSIALLPGPARALPVSENDPGSRAELSNLGVAYQLFDAVFNKRDADLARTIMSDDAIIHTAYGDYVGPAGLIDYISMLYRAYPDARFDVSSISVNGDTVTVDWSMSATRFQIEPTEPLIRANFNITGVATFSISDARIADLFLNQAGVASEPAEISSANPSGVYQCYRPCVP